MYQSLKNAIKKIYERFIKLKGARREIALGFALGLFIGMSPFFGMHIAISVVIASILGWSKIAAAVGVNDYQRLHRPPDLSGHLLGGRQGHRPRETCRLAHLARL